jgi:hypothetical protein
MDLVTFDPELLSQDMSAEDAATEPFDPTVFNSRDVSSKITFL